MGNTVPFRCPACGSEKFVKKAEAKPNDPMPCAKCGRLFTQKDVRAQGARTAEKMLSDAMSKVPGFKRR